MRNARLNDPQAGIKISGRNINNLRYADDTTLMEESEEKLKSLLMQVKKQRKDMRKKMETVTYLFTWALKSIQTALVTAAMTLKDTCFLE